MKEEKRFTHRQLEEAGVKWLAKWGYWWSCNHIAIEPASPGCRSETPDVIGFACGITHVIECKTCRADFFRDLSKPWRTSTSIFPMGTHRWWLCEEGVITFDDLSGSGDGLLWVMANGAVQPIRYPTLRSDDERNISGELCILYNLLNKEAETEVTIYW